MAQEIHWIPLIKRFLTQINSSPCETDQCCHHLVTSPSCDIITQDIITSHILHPRLEFLLGVLLIELFYSQQRQAQLVLLKQTNNINYIMSLQMLHAKVCWFFFSNEQGVTMIWFWNVKFLCLKFDYIDNYIV